MIGLMLELTTGWLFGALAVGIAIVTLSELIARLLSHCPSCGEGLVRKQEHGERSFPATCPDCGARLR
jgi:predicted RNA-binding Zn-ribbon protein involved in translation (DUF1610 family)